MLKRYKRLFKETGEKIKVLQNNTKGTGNNNLVIRAGEDFDREDVAAFAENWLKKEYRLSKELKDKKGDTLEMQGIYEENDNEYIVEYTWI